jgi:hypothetical protein
MGFEKELEIKTKYTLRKKKTTTTYTLHSKVRFIQTRFSPFGVHQVVCLPLEHRLQCAEILFFFNKELPLGYIS